VSTPASRQDAYYRGIRMVPYDVVKELSLALIATLVLVIVLAAALSSPDVAPETIQSWSRAQPIDFVTTATGELAGTTTSSDYGPPYNDGSGGVLSWGFFSPQTWLGGIRTPVDSANDFVLKPLRAAAVGNVELADALSGYDAASATDRQGWLDAYTKALGKATVQNGQVVVDAGDYGPLTTMMASLLQLARAGALDGYLLSNGHFYQTDYTSPLMFMGDGNYLASLAENQHLLGEQWGMMNETGLYPGQTWLWLFTLWYQIPPYNSADNADLLVVLTMGVLSLALVLVPFIPIIRDIPRWLPVHRLIWRTYNRGESAQPTPPPAATSPHPTGRT
jgi:hypothetical protein